ncbi:MAG: DsbA family protein [Rhodomicrobium sp.]|nr:DsbA family protein [Rhodomicrobium sp.]
MTGRRSAIAALSRVAIAAAMLLTLSGCTGGVPEALTLASDSQDASPTPAQIRKAGPLGERGLGNPQAPVTIIEYASLGCPVCAAYHKQVLPKIKQAYIDTGKVYFIFREFPIGETPAAAAHAARCVPEKDFFRINEKFMANRGKWNSRDPNPDLLYKIVQETGLSRAAFDSCMANQKIKEGLTEVKQRGRGFGVKGTPAFFVNGQPVRGNMSFEEMRKLIEQHLQGAAKPA